MLKISNTKLTEQRKDGVRFGGDSRAGHNGRCKFNKSETGDDEVNDEVERKVKKRLSPKICLSPKNCLSSKKQ